MRDDNTAVLYQHVRSALSDEQGYARHLDEKAAHLLALHSAVIAGFTILVFMASSLFLPPQHAIGWLAGIFVLLTYVGLISAWSLLFRLLRPSDAYGVELPETWLEDMKQQGANQNAHLAIVRCYSVWQKLNQNNQQKNALLKKAYHEIVFSAWLIAIALLFLLAAKYLGTD
ncbi:hypothetical protein L4174_017380 [Photobacterium sp. CCB-ST2H9]|uniref:hypothetical protein n=1 Tax=unclassified Photobacterium TaxID=2628852 RepID=UPI0020053614|nr:hypothetical protein [Photobacterium sp. CCB-ST2H9]UTM59844.1 hypothetical protein L4174_017380 [Photobacterium sp. CCB-ST2H9]